jgi:hypothetical protein
MERCHARKSKIHSNIFEITFPFEVGCSMFVSCSVIIRHSNVRRFDYSKVATSSRLIEIQSSNHPITQSPRRMTLNRVDEYNAEDHDEEGDGFDDPEDQQIVGEPFFSFSKGIA